MDKETFDKQVARIWEIYSAAQTLKTATKGYAPAPLINRAALASVNERITQLCTNLAGDLVDHSAE